jgi:hypothetical protein
MQLFIDTNVLLSFYHVSSDDLEELKKLVVLLGQKKVQLYVPSQVKMEFRRNREVKIADALRKFKEQRLSLQFPQICKDYPEYGKLRDLQKQYETTHSSLLNSLNEHIRANSLKADQIIEQLFTLGEPIASGETIIGKARLRLDLGNPPGKNDSLGDAVNWEGLLAAVPEKSDLHFISGDRDYCSALDEEEFSQFLEREWRTKKKSELIFYKRISAFFKEQFPDIKFATELEKDLLIKDFAQSGSFATTHAVVAKLTKFADFTPAQLNAIVSAALSNSQVRHIVTDQDVQEFLSTLISGHEDQIEDKDDLAALQSLLKPDASQNWTDGLSIEEL